MRTVLITMIGLTLVSCGKSPKDLNFKVELPNEVKVEGVLDSNAPQAASMYQHAIAVQLGVK